MSGPHGPQPATDLRLEDLDYLLPAQLVAQRPREPRDASRLLVWRASGVPLEDRCFRELPSLLHRGDVLVRNDTRVFPARSFFVRPTGGRLEVLFLAPVGVVPDGASPGERCEVLMRGRPREGEHLRNETLGERWTLIAVRSLGDGRWLVESLSAQPVLERLGEAGHTPLPPYIHADLDDPERYQTTYARSVGSAAAPTAGLHFTARLDAALRAAGVSIETVTLHVGLGTFRPLQEDALAANRLHGEAYDVDAAVWGRLTAARGAGRRVVAIGTTTVRVLEHLALATADADSVTTAPLRGVTDLFITPGFRFRMVDAMLTNFHLPRSSLLALVMAFCGVEETRRAYAYAVTQGYRFYSFGDAMLAGVG